MAKTSMIMREKRRARVVKKYAAKRARIKEAIRDPKASQEDRMAAIEALQKLPRDSSPVRKRSRCAITGRTRGNFIVHFRGGSDLFGHLVDVRVTGHSPVSLRGEIAG